MIVAAGTVVPRLVVPAKSVGTAKPAKCIVWSSSTPLTSGRTACAGGIQDNLAVSTDIGVRNPDCNGSGMTYQSGMTLVSIPSGAFTLANGTATNTSAYNDVAKMWTVECTTTNCQAIDVADSTALPQTPRGGTGNAGTWITVRGVTPTLFSGTFQVCAAETLSCAEPTTNTFSYHKRAGDQSGSGGTVQTFVGEARSNVSVGDPIEVSNCADASFNAPPVPNILAIAPTVPGGNTVTYPNADTPNATTTCDYSNGVGLPEYVTIKHNTIVASLTSSSPTSAQTIRTANFPNHSMFVDNIFTGGGFSASGGEGTYVSEHYWNTSTLTYHHNVQADRAIRAWKSNTPYRIGDVIKPSSPSRRYVAVTSGTSGASQPMFSNNGHSCNTDNTVVWQNIGLLPAQYGDAYDYTEYLFPNGASVRPPKTIYFPAHAYCYGATADSSCVGFRADCRPKP